MPKKHEPRGRAKPNKNAKARVEVKIDRALKRAWDEQLAVVHKSRREGASAFDELWEAVALIVEHDPPLYLAGGFATKKAFLEQHLEESDRNARRLIRIAKYASPAEEVRWGISKLDAILDYLEAKTGGAIRGRLPIALDAIRITVQRNAEPHRLALDDLTIAEIQAESRKLRREAKPRGKRPPAVIALTKQLRGAKLGKVAVRLAHGHLSFTGIPLDAFAAFLTALRKVALPEA